jgi:hypothetical protein
MYMIEEVGEVAGKIWQFLNERGELSISRVISEMNVSQTIAYMGLGWLAREDKIEFIKRNRGVFVRLK